MKIKTDNLKLGFVLGIIAPALTIIIVYFVKFTEYNITELVDLLVSKRVLTKIISLCIIPNLPMFFFFLNKSYYQSARGILMATILFAVFVFVTKFTLG